MDKILEDAGLSTIQERFKEKRIDPEIVIAMSDVELARLGVQTIGDRIRLHSACRGKTMESQSCLKWSFRITSC